MNLSKPACFAIVALMLPTLAYGQSAPTSKSRTLPGMAAQSEPTPNNPVKGPDTADQQFMKQAAIGDMAEIQLGQMAQAKATDPKVKSFGERMVKDHSTADDLLKNLAQQQHVSVTADLDPQHKNEQSMLSNKSGSEFDKDYIRLMVHNHQKTIQKFKHEAASSTDPTLKAFARNTLPTLQSHLQEAQKIQSELGSQ